MIAVAPMGPGNPPSSRVMGEYRVCPPLASCEAGEGTTATFTVLDKGSGSPVPGSGYLKKKPGKHSVTADSPAAAGLNTLRPLPPIGILTTRIANAAPAAGTQYGKSGRPEGLLSRR